MSDDNVDHELLVQARSGDLAAMHKLLLSHYSRLAKHIDKRIPREAQGTISADDVIQQTFLQVMRHIGQFTPQADHSFFAWLKRIAENGLTDALRRFACEKRGDNAQVRGLVPDDSAMTNLVELISAGSHTPSRSVARHEAVAAVRQAIDDLPSDYRQVVQLRLLEGRSLEETAAIVNRSPRAVQGLIDRAKKKMRAALGSLSLYE